MYLTVLLLISATVYAEQACDFSKIPVQKDFNEGKFLGTWYEIEWWPAEHWKNTTVDNVSDNFAFTISRKDGEVATLFYQSYFSFHGSTECNTDRTMTRKIRSPGIYQMTGSGDDPYRGFTQIVWTDYDKMMVEFVCYTYSGSVCSNSAVAFWSRTTTLSSVQLNSADKLLEQLCTTGKTMFKIRHTTDCPKQGPPTNTSPGIFNASVFFIIIISVVSKLFE